MVVFLEDSCCMVDELGHQVLHVLVSQGFIVAHGAMQSPRHLRIVHVEFAFGLDILVPQIGIKWQMARGPLGR